MRSSCFWKSKWRERESAVSGSQNVREWVLGRQVYIGNPCHVTGSKCMGQNQRCRHSCEHKSRDFNSRFLRPISLPTSTIFVLGTRGITAILKYRSVNPIKVTVIPVIVRTFEIILKNLEKRPGKLEIQGEIETVQIIALVRLARMLRRIEESWRDLLSL